MSTSILTSAIVTPSSHSYNCAELPDREARGLLGLLKRGESIASIRAMIGTANNYRKRVLLHFDILTGNLSPALRAKVVAELRLHSLREVHEKLGLTHEVLRRISQETNAPSLKIGRGKRFTSQQREIVLAAVRADRRSVDIRRELHVSDWLVQKLRREIGDNENRLYRRNYSLVQVQEALREGRGLADIEREFGICHAVLWKVRKAMGDLEDRRRRPRHVLSDAERESVFADIRASLSQRAIAKKYHLHLSRVRSMQREARA